MCISVAGLCSAGVKPQASVMLSNLPAPELHHRLLSPVPCPCPLSPPSASEECLEHRPPPHVPHAVTLLLGPLWCWDLRQEPPHTRLSIFRRISFFHLNDSAALGLFQVRFMLVLSRSFKYYFIYILGDKGLLAVGSLPHLVEAGFLFLLPCCIL